jgi:cation transporter-like permease
MLEVIVMIALIGVIAWLITQLPMPQPFRNVIVGLLLVLVILWALQTLGVALPFRMPRLR